MSIVIFLFQIVFLYIIIRVLWAFFGGRRQTSRTESAKPKPKRFNTDGKDVADASFKDIKD